MWPTNCARWSFEIDFPLVLWLWKWDSCDAVPFHSNSSSDPVRQSPLNPFTGIWRWTAVWHDSHSCMWHNPLSKSLPRSLLAVWSFKLELLLTRLNLPRDKVSMNVGAELKLKSNSHISHPNMRIYCSSLTAKYCNTLQFYYCVHTRDEWLDEWMGTRAQPNRICFFCRSSTRSSEDQFFSQ